MEYYKVYKPIKTKDSRGNLIRTFEEVGEIRGNLVTKINSVFSSDGRYIQRQDKTMIMTRNYKEQVKNGYKVDNYIVTEVLDNKRDIVLFLDGDSSGNWN